MPLAERPGWVNRVWERLAEELAQGRQGFVVCPAIEAGAVEDDPDALAEPGAQPPTAANVTQTLAAMRANQAVRGQADRGAARSHAQR